MTTLGLRSQGLETSQHRPLPPPPFLVVPSAIIWSREGPGQPEMEAKVLISIFILLPLPPVLRTSLKHYLQVTGALNRNVNLLFIPTCCAGPCGTEYTAFIVGDILPNASAVGDFTRVVSAVPTMGSQIMSAWILPFHYVIGFPASETQNQDRTTIRGEFF